MTLSSRAALLVLSVLSVGELARAQKTPDVRLDVGSPPGASSSLFPQLAASGSSVYVVWQDERNGPEEVDDIYFNRSLDGGATWLASDVRLSSQSFPTQPVASPRIVASGPDVYVTWCDSRNGYADVYFNRSLDGGATWLPSEVRLDTGSAPGSAPSVAQKIALSGSSVFVTWQDGRSNGFDIYFNRSLDGGTTWLPVDVRIDVGDPPGQSFSAIPDIAAAGSSVYVAWQDARNNLIAYDIYLNRSLDGGASWLPSALRLDLGSAPGAARSFGPDLALAGSSLGVVWRDWRNGLDDVYFNRSLDGGVTWLQTDVRLDTGSAPGAATSGPPTLVAAGSSFFSAWHDDRNGSYDIYLNRSIDEGATWLANDVRLDTGSAPGSATSLNPSFAASGSSLYVCWQDERNAFGVPDIYFDLALGFQTYGAGTPGSGGLVPTLSGSGVASIGGTFSVDVANGLGGATGALFVGMQGPASIKVDGGTLLVQPPLTRIPLKLSGPSGSPGAGSTSVSFPIPNDVSLIGTRLDFQARFFDPGDPQPGQPAGVSFTAGLEAWIL